jgi:predicted Zn-dependent protease with MMP-like domain
MTKAWPLPIFPDTIQGTVAMSSRQPETHEEFEVVANDVWENLPSQFREVVGNLAIQIEDFAGRETLDHMRIDSRYGLLGLYHGVGLPFKSVSALPYGPDMIFLYRVPILAFARDEGLNVPDVIKHVLIHEIGHHFGFSDEDMDVIEAGEA